MNAEIQIERIDARQRQVWDEFVARAPHFALMQGYGWGEFKERLGWQAIRLAAKQEGQIIAAAQMLIKSAPLGLFSIAYIPRGPLVDWNDTATTSALLDAIHREARRRRAILLKIEPALLQSPQAQATLADYGFHPSPYTNQPRATIILDLSPDLDSILMKMNKKARYNIRRAARKGVTVRIGDRQDLPTLIRMMQITGQRAGFPPRAPEYYEQQWKTLAPLGQVQLLVADYRDRALAIAMIAMLGGHAAGLHLASSNEHRDLKANHALVWEAIRQAKTHGCRTFDLWGIPEEVGQTVYEGNPLPLTSRTDGLWGVYRFKRGFCRNIVYYVTAHIHAYLPFLRPIATGNFLKTDQLDRVAVWLDRLKGSKPR